MNLTKDALKRRLTVTIDGDRAWVELSGGKRCCIDIADAPLVEGRVWFVIKSGGGRTMYAASKRKDRTVDLMHRVITGCPKGMETDHRDGDGLNNMRSNLRVCSHAENGRNRRTHRNNKTGLKGVGLNRNGTYSARIFKSGTSYNLGDYKSPEEAHAAYCKAAKEKHGAFARAG